MQFMLDVFFVLKICILMNSQVTSLLIKQNPDYEHDIVYSMMFQVEHLYKSNSISV